MSSNIEIKKKCRWCGAEFIARKTTTEYCSHQCSGLAYKERKRQEKLDSYQREYEYQQSGQKEVAKQEFLTPTQAATLLTRVRDKEHHKKQLNQQLEKAADSFGNITDIQ